MAVRILYNVGFRNKTEGDIVLYVGDTDTGKKFFGEFFLNTIPDPDVEEFRYVSADAVRASLAQDKAFVDPNLDYSDFVNELQPSFVADATLKIADANITNKNATLKRLYTGQPLYAMLGDNVTKPTTTALNSLTALFEKGPLFDKENPTAPSTPATGIQGFVNQVTTFVKNNLVLVAVGVVLLWKPVIRPALASLGVIKKRGKK